MARSTNPARTMAQVTLAMDQALDRLYGDINRELYRQTPKATGTAARGWQQGPRSRIGDGVDQVIARNPVDYVEYLNQGHSSQAPAGYIDDILRNASNRNR